MKQVFDKLRSNEYVNADNVAALRKYIRIKNPGSSPEELSAVFADALHRIIDIRIFQFDENHRKKIKEHVLRKAARKKEFSINAAEVFSTCLSLKLRGEGYVESLSQWINQNQDILVSAEEVDRLISIADGFEEAYIESNPEAIVEKFDDSLAMNTLVDEAAVNPPGEKSIADAGLVEGFEPEEAAKLNLEKLLKPARRIMFAAAGSLKYMRPSMKLVLPAAVPLVIVTAFAVTWFFGGYRVQALLPDIPGRYVNIAEERLDRYLSLESKVHNKLKGLKSVDELILADGLQNGHKYKAVDRGKLNKWLKDKNSLLSEEPYFSAILAVSEQYDINPLLMFAIVGQEQGFVPKSHASARKIANNPFNVYGSWEKYNTDIHESSRLAADTIIKSSRNRPVYINAIRWINRRYAEDPDWWKGVYSFFVQLENAI